MVGRTRCCASCGAACRRLPVQRLRPTRTTPWDPMSWSGVLRRSSRKVRPPRAHSLCLIPTNSAPAQGNLLPRTSPRHHLPASYRRIRQRARLVQSSRSHSLCPRLVPSTPTPSRTPTPPSRPHLHGRAQPSPSSPSPPQEYPHHCLPLAGPLRSKAPRVAVLPSLPQPHPRRAARQWSATVLAAPVFPFPPPSPSPPSILDLLSRWGSRRTATRWRGGPENRSGG